MDRFKLILIVPKFEPSSQIHLFPIMQRNNIACFYLSRLLPDRLINESKHIFGNPEKAARYSKLSRDRSNEKIKKLLERVDLRKIARVKMRSLKTDRRGPTNSPSLLSRREDSFDPFGEVPGPRYISNRNDEFFQQVKSPPTLRSLSVQRLPRKNSSKKLEATQKSLSPLKQTNMVNRSGSLERLEKLINECSSFNQAYYKRADISKPYEFDPLINTLFESERGLSYKNSVKVQLPKLNSFVPRRLAKSEANKL